MVELGLEFLEVALGVTDGLGVFLSELHSLVRRIAACLLLDGIEPGDPLDDFFWQ